jgi:hypothetical protein
MKREHAERIADIAARVEAWRAFQIKLMEMPDHADHDQEEKSVEALRNELGIPLNCWGSWFEGTIDDFDRWSKSFMRECVRHVTTGRPSLEFEYLLDCVQDLDFSWFLIGIPYKDLSHKESMAFLMSAFGFDEKDARRLAIEEDEDEGVLLSSSSDVTPPLHPEPDLF